MSSNETVLMESSPAAGPRPRMSPAVGRRVGALLLALLFCLSGPQARAEPITLNFKDADISAVIATVSEMTGRNFIVDPRVKGKVTVISAKPMESEALYQVFLAVLNVHGFAAVPAKGATKIVPLVNAKQDAIPVADSRAPGRGDEQVTRVIAVENVAAAQLVPILRPLLPQQGHLAAYPAGNVLIVSDSAANVERLARIIMRIDMTGVREDEIEVIRLGHASAAEVVRILQTLEKSAEKGKAPEGRSTLVADERTNSVLIGGATAQRLRLRAIISHLDTPLEAGGNTEVIYLRYANAKDLVAVLTGVSTSISKDKKGQKTASPGQGAASIQADESTNALVINAPADVMRSLKAVVRQLDIRRAQVLVKAVIAEISSDKVKELGIQWAYDGASQDAPVGLINFGGAGGVAGLAAQIKGGTLSTPPDGLSLAAGDLRANGTRFGAFIRALAGDGDTNVLSTPTLVTMDNEEAEIVVGENVPFITGSYTSTGTGTSPENPFQTIQRQDVGITLKVKPQINEGDAVKLEITQEVSSIGAAPTGAADIVTTKRALKTTVLVDSGQAVVLGGLMDDKLTESLQKVPGLGDIPLLGWLFSYKKTTKLKRNLMVFLHPTILRDATQSARVSGEKYNFMRAQQLGFRERGVALMSDDVSPLLPEWEQFLNLPVPFEESASTPPVLPTP